MAQVRFENVNLEYPVRESSTTTLKEFLLRGLFLNQAKKVETIKALNDLTFEIPEGERVGIIGLNGAGKSTLLKTVAGIYPIRSGKKIVQGTIGSMFDIYLGFEPDATGWQNIYYRSYLQGETPRTVKETLHEIADFTELGRFLDLPIRCYSSGMVMRLAFAIATARSPEILLIDEVIGTGDLHFQKRAVVRLFDCVNKAQIVLVASQQLEVLQAFCTSVMWLEKGHLKKMGPTKAVIDEFKAEGAPPLQIAA